MSRSSLMRGCFVLVAALVLSGCTRAAPLPTATPTKTPAPVAAAVDTPTPTPVQLPTATPVADIPTPTEAPPPDGISRFTGLPADNPENLKHRPIFIVVNNDPAGRAAHYGLSQADLVYEYIVDGFSITRLAAMFQSREAERVGPVRSARMPNVWMTYMYDGVLAASGGSDEVRYLLKNEVGFPYLDADIDDPSQTRYFQSIGTDYRTRMQSSTAGVRRWLADKGLIKDWSRPGFEFSDQPPGSAAGTATDIQITYPGGNNVEWRYDPSLNGYLRFQAGEQQFDPATGRPIVAQNVIALTAEHTLTDMVEDSLGTKGVDIALYGFGDFRIFRDGQVYEGTWRADPETPPRWLGPGEAIVKLKPGQSWVQVLRGLNEITYQ